MPDRIMTKSGIYAAQAAPDDSPSTADRLQPRRLATLTMGFAAVVMFGSLEAIGPLEAGLMGLAFLAVLVASGAMCVRGVLQRRSDLLFRGALVGVGLLATGFVTGAVTRAQVSESQRRGDQVCLALEAYAARVGHYPATLSGLVPADLPVVPRTAMGVLRSRDFRYESSEAHGYWLHFDMPGFASYSRGRFTPWTCND